MEWSVLIEAVSPGDWEVDEDEIGEQAAELLELLADYGPAVTAGPRSWSARVAVDAYSALDAAGLGSALVTECAAKAGLPPWPVARCEATEWDLFEADLDKPTFPDLVGSQEVAEMLDVSRQRLHELRNSGRFPRPLVHLAATPVWLRPAVETFLEGWHRQPGRPRIAQPPST